MWLFIEGVIVAGGVGGLLLLFELRADDERATRAEQFENVVLVRSTQSGRPSFQSLDLRGAPLVGLNLSGADFRGADLRGADLSGADLRYADLRGAKLDGASMVGADLTAALIVDATANRLDLTGATVVDLVICRTSLRDSAIGLPHFGGAILTDLDDTTGAYQVVDYSETVFTVPVALGSFEHDGDGCELSPRHDPTPRPAGMDFFASEYFDREDMVRLHDGTSTWTGGRERRRRS